MGTTTVTCEATDGSSICNFDVTVVDTTRPSLHVEFKELTSGGSSDSDSDCFVVLCIEAEDGWLNSPFDIVYRARTRPFPDDYQVQLSGVRIHVVASTPDGRPRKVNFTFERELENESLRWVLYEDGRYDEGDRAGCIRFVFTAGVLTKAVTVPTMVMS